MVPYNGARPLVLFPCPGWSLLILGTGFLILEALLRGQRGLHFIRGLFHQAQHELLLAELFACPLALPCEVNLELLDKPLQDLRRHCSC